MASSFTGSNPQVDVLPDAPSTQITHDTMHNDERASVMAIQQWIRTYVLPIFNAGWVTASRIATNAVTDSKIASVSWTKVTPTNGQFYWGGHVRSTGHIIADGAVQGYDGVRGGPDAIGFPAVYIQWLRGVTNGSGAITLAHNGASLQRRVILGEVWFRGAGGEARNLLPTGFVVDGTNITITGAPANTRVRVGIVYMADNDSEWV